MISYGVETLGSEMKNSLSMLFKSNNLIQNPSFKFRLSIIISNAMHNFSFKVFITFIIFFCAVAGALAQDSVAAKQLDEIVVTGERGWIDGNTINYIPTRKEKRLADSPASLIKAMHLPMLSVRDGNIVNGAGNTVAVFINGQRANDIDISTFWPKDVKKVQYVENSNDPLFEGVPYVVNFITSRYLVGGVSKINLFQRIPTKGIYTLSSKTTYKKMTFGMKAYYLYSRDNRTIKETDYEYRDIYYDDNFHNLIERHQEEKSTERANYAECAFNAKYTGSKFIATHTVSMTYDHNPYSTNSGSDRWTDNIFDSSYSWNAEKSKSVSPRVSGNYVYVFSPKWYITGLWQYAYSGNRSRSWNQTCDTDIVYNQYRENVNSCNFSLVPTFLCNSKFSFQLLLTSSLNWFDSRYMGSADTDNNMATQDLISSLKIYWIPSKKFYLMVEPGLTGAFKQIGDVRNNSVIPTLKVWASYNPGRRFNIGASVSHYTHAASASESNPVLVKASELMWSMGNPYLKNGRYWDMTVSANHILSNAFSMAYALVYHHSNNDIISTYTPADQTTGGLVRQMTNAGPAYQLYGKVSFRLSLLDNNLSLGASPKWQYDHFSSGQFRAFNWVSASADVDYTIGDFQISAEYDGPRKDIDSAGREKNWYQDCWNASVVYGSDNIRLEARVYDIFNKRARSKTEFVSPNYLTRLNLMEIGREVSISLTYTFGYGKKIDRDIDIDSGAATESSILKLR